LGRKTTAIGVLRPWRLARSSAGTGPDTLILETTFKTDEGSSCHGFHAAQIRRIRIVRIVEDLEGRVGKKGWA
jgi:hypothetical protein